MTDQLKTSFSAYNASSINLIYEFTLQNEMIINILVVSSEDMKLSTKAVN